MNRCYRCSQPLESDADWSAHNHSQCTRSELDALMDEAEAYAERQEAERQAREDDVELAERDFDPSLFDQDYL